MTSHDDPSTDARPREDGDPPWLLRERDGDGAETWTVRALFWAVTGPSYFGPFASRDEALDFYNQATDVMGNTVCELANMAAFLKLSEPELPSGSEAIPLHAGRQRQRTRRSPWRA